MELQRKTITISEIKANEGRYVVKDEKGLSYSFFEKKQNGDYTKAYQDFSNLSIAVNSIVSIGVKEKKDGPTTYRNIMFFAKPTPEQEAHAEPFANSADIEKKEEDKWSKIREEKNTNIKWNMSLRLAVEAWYNDKIDKDQIVEVANWFYQLEPRK